MLAAALALLTNPLPPVARQTVPDAPGIGAAAELAARIDTYLGKCVAAGFAGSLLVLREGEAVLDRGYGLADREKDVPNAPETLHAIGSITKQFTAAAILKLEEQGKLDVRDRMSKHLPDVPSDKAGITLHQLLTHSAGFPGAIGDDYEPIEREAFVKLALATPLVFAPGQGYEYSNVGYSLLGAIVERLSGQSYERYLHDQLLAPAGLAHTGYRIPAWSECALAIGYTKGGERWGTMLDHPWAADGPYWHLRCNGGLLSTTHDMARWIQALADGSVLGPASVEKLFQPYVQEGPGAPSHYGYGWAIFETPRGTRLITHNGGNGVQFADLLWYADEDLIVSLQSNASARGMQDIAWEVARICFDPSYAPEPPQPRVLAGLPPGPIGNRLRALSTLIASTPDDAALTAWLKDNLGPGFLEGFPLEHHLEVFRELCQGIGPHTIEGVLELATDEYQLQLRSQADASLYRIDLRLRPSDALIAGLRADH